MNKSKNSQTESKKNLSEKTQDKATSGGREKILIAEAGLLKKLQQMAKATQAEAEELQRVSHRR